jgi:hypothetical protein
VILTLTADLSSSIYGPFGNKSQNDLLVMQQFLQSGRSASPNRGFYAAGSGFVEGTPSLAAVNFMLNILGVDLMSSNYLQVAANTAPSVDLNPTAALPLAFGNVYGIRSACATTLDVLDRSATLLSETADASYYEDPLALGPFTAGVIKTHSATNPWVAMVDGFDVALLGSMNGTSSRGRLHYFCRMLQDAFGALGGCNGVGGPCGLTGVDVDGQSGPLVNFLQLLGNPVRHEATTFRFGLARADRVRIVVYDVAGRKVREIADRRFAAGEHSIVWDGIGEQGRRVARGVYFVRAHYETQGFEARAKLVMVR